MTSKSPWINHVKYFAEKHGLSYACALSTPACKESYKNRNVTSSSTSSSSSSGVASRTFQTINILNDDEWKKIEEENKKRRANARPPTTQEIESMKYRTLRNEATYYTVNLENIKEMKPEDVLLLKQRFMNESEEFKKFFKESASEEYEKLLKYSKKYEKQSKEKKTRKKQ